jgi:hypothetical protein
MLNMESWVGGYLMFLVKEASAQQTLKRERARETTFTSFTESGLVHAMYVWTGRGLFQMTSILSHLAMFILLD